MREDARQRANEFVKELCTAGEIDSDRFGTGVAGVLAARSEAELAEMVQSLPAPMALTSQERRLAEPLEIHSGLGRLRLAGAGDPPPGRSALAARPAGARDAAGPARRDHQYRQSSPAPPGNPGPHQTLAGQQKAPIASCVHRCYGHAGAQQIATDAW